MFLRRALRSVLHHEGHGRSRLWRPPQRHDRAAIGGLHNPARSNPRRHATRGYGHKGPALPDMPAMQRHHVPACPCSQACLGGGASAGARGSADVVQGGGMGRSARRQREEHPDPLPEWIRPQLTELVKEAPSGPEWLHEIKFDGYRMHPRLHRGSVRLLTRTGLDWTHKYPAIAAAVAALPADQAYLDGELCGVRPDGTTSFSLMQAASDTGNAAALVFFLFDLLYLHGETLGAAPLRDRKERLPLSRPAAGAQASGLRSSGRTVARSVQHQLRRAALRSDEHLF